jgi:hypothetical protein
MTNRTMRNVAILLAACAAAFGGCEKKKKPAPPPPPPPPPKVELPKPVDIQALLQEMKSDARVKFADEQSPADRSLAESVIKFSNAFVKGEANTMKSMLDRPSQVILDKLVSTGDWEAETKPIEQVRIVSMSNTTELPAEKSTVGMAIQAPGGAYLLAWNASKAGDTWTFAAAPSQQDSKPRASDFDGVSISTSVLPAETTSITRPTSGAPGEKAPEAPAPATDPSGPRRKQTPAGPITIPGG